MIPHTIDRRRFLQLTGSVAAFSLLPRSLYGFAPNAAPENPSDGSIALNFLEPTEVLICGSTLFACDLAVRSAKAGKRTTLVMDRVNPFFEGIACLRSWVDAADLPGISPLIRGVATNAQTSVTKEGKVYFNALKAANDIEDQLCEAGVRFYYNAPVAGALGCKGKLRGVVFGGKTGLFAVESPVVVDATLEATVARAAGARFVPKSGPRRYHYVADLAQPVGPRTAQYVSSGGIKVNASIHHYYACMDMELGSNSTGPLAYAENFEQLYAASLECPLEPAEKRFRGADGYLTSGVDRLEPKDGKLSGFENLFVFGPQGIPGNTEGSLVLKDLKALFVAFPKALEQIHGTFAALSSPTPECEFWNRGIPADSAPPAAMMHSFRDHGFAEPGVRALRVQFTPPKLALQTELLVVGGGTSGNAATYAAGKLGLKTVCLERSLELGGTNTVGGVTNLWYGNKTEAFADYYKAMDAKNDGLNAPGFFKGVKKAGARVLFESATTGVAYANRQVNRVYILTPFGLSAVAAPRWIDATGDGSLAAWAGCGYTFGGMHDEMTLWASFAGFKAGHQEALRPFLSPCDERSAMDTTRFILAMRRNTKVSLLQPHLPPPFFLAPRESRHILGGKTLTYLDVLAGRRFSDGVFRVESNPDIKGLATSDAATAGFIPTSWRRLFQATVPYSAMIPVQLDNVIIAGKAYSVTHDALAVARMQRDLCVMGMVAAEAVRLAVNQKTLLRNIPIQELQRILISKKMLKESDLASDDYGFGCTPEEMARQVASAPDMDSALAGSAMLCLIPKEKALAAVEPYAASPNPAMHRLLCFLGHPKGVAQYLSSVEAALGENPLSKELFGGSATSHNLPDQGYAPVSALMLGALAAARETRVLTLLQKLAEKVNLEADELRSGWGYLYILAFGWERLASAQGVAGLKRVLGGALLQNRVVERTGDLRKCQAYVPERYAYLRMALSRALLRCGDPQGALELCAFLNEARVCFARAARAELVAAFGKDCGFDVGQWKQQIQEGGKKLKANPRTDSFL